MMIRVFCTESKGNEREREREERGVEERSNYISRIGRLPTSPFVFGFSFRLVLLVAFFCVLAIERIGRAADSLPLKEFDLLKRHNIGTPL